MYNEIMRHIEPDLLTTVLPQLARYYANEMPAERHARFSSYARAFRAFDLACTAIDKQYHPELRQMRTAATDVVSASGDVDLPPLSPDA